MLPWSRPNPAEKWGGVAGLSKGHRFGYLKVGFKKKCPVQETESIPVVARKNDFVNLQTRETQKKLRPQQFLTGHFECF